eukprot:PhM_4_TR12434/c0_g1_i1/m.30389
MTTPASCSASAAPTSVSSFVHVSAQQLSAPPSSMQMHCPDSSRNNNNNNNNSTTDNNSTTANDFHEIDHVLLGTESEAAGVRVAETSGNAPTSSAALPSWIESHVTTTDTDDNDAVAGHLTMSGAMAREAPSSPPYNPQSSHHHHHQHQHPSGGTNSRVLVRLNRLSEQLSFGTLGLPAHHSDCLQRVTEMMLNDDDLRQRVAMMVHEADGVSQHNEHSPPASEHPYCQSQSYATTTTTSSRYVTPVSSQEFEDMFAEPFVRLDTPPTRPVDPTTTATTTTSNVMSPLPALPPPMPPTTTPAASVSAAATTVHPSSGGTAERIIHFFSSLFGSLSAMLGVSHDPSSNGGSLPRAGSHHRHGQVDREKVIQALSYVLAAGCMVVLVRRLDKVEARKVMGACVGVVQRAYHNALM